MRPGRAGGDRVAAVDPLAADLEVEGEELARPVAEEGGCARLQDEGLDVMRLAADLAADQDIVYLGIPCPAHGGDVGRDKLFCLHVRCPSPAGAN